MSVFVNREGNISVFRVGIFMLIFGIIIVVGGYIIFTIEQSRFNSPLNIDSYPGALEMGIDTRASNQQIVIYRVPDATVEEVFQYYDAEMVDHYDADPDPLSRENDERCSRFPASGAYPDYVEGSGNVQYYYSCLFNDSQYGNNRWTEVRIMPGLLTLAADGSEIENTLGQTRIEYDQGWQR